MSRDRMLREMSSAELTDWMALYDIRYQEAQERSLSRRGY